MNEGETSKVENYSNVKVDQRAWEVSVTA